MGGHSNAVSSIITNGVDPQIITGSHDSTVKLWDLAAGKAMTTLTQHKKGIRSMAVNPRVQWKLLTIKLVYNMFFKCYQEFSFATGASDNIKKWQCRDGT